MNRLYCAYFREIVLLLNQGVLTTMRDETELFAQVAGIGDSSGICSRK